MHLDNRGFHKKANAWKQTHCGNIQKLRVFKCSQNHVCSRSGTQTELRIHAKATCFHMFSCYGEALRNERSENENYVFSNVFVLGRCGHTRKRCVFISFLASGRAAQVRTETKRDKAEYGQSPTRTKPSTDRAQQGQSRVQTEPKRDKAEYGQSPKGIKPSTDRAQPEQRRVRD